MSDTKQLQFDALQRVAYMLDEYSVQYLAQRDDRFRQAIDDLYMTLDRQASRLQTSS